MPFWTTPYIIFFLWTRREHGKKIFFSPLFLTDSLSTLNLKKTPTQPVAYHPPAGAPVYPALSPDRTEAGHFHRPSLPINTEAEKRHRGVGRRRKGTRGKNRGEEKRESGIKEKNRKKKKEEEEEAENNEKQRRERGEKNRAPPATAVPPPRQLRRRRHQHRLNATAGQPSSLSSSTFVFFFCIFLSTVHVACEQWRGPLLTRDGLM